MRYAHYSTETTNQSNILQMGKYIKCRPLNIFLPSERVRLRWKKKIPIELAYFISQNRKRAILK